MFELLNTRKLLLARLRSLENYKDSLINDMNSAYDAKTDASLFITEYHKLRDILKLLARDIKTNKYEIRKTHGNKTNYTHVYFR